MTMTLNVLHVEDDRVDAKALAMLLDKGGYHGLKLTQTDSLTKAKALLAKDAYDLILLDLGLPEEQGVDSLLTVRSAAPGTPVVVLSGRDDLDTAQQLTTYGAEDYSVKGRDSAQELARKIACARERHFKRFTLDSDLAELKQRQQAEDRDHDALSGLLNRRGLEAALDAFGRTGRQGFAILVNVDGLKVVNDELGRQAGDQILHAVGGRIAAALEEAELAAGRIGGDEFLVVGLGSMDDAGVKADLLHRALMKPAIGKVVAGAGPVTCRQAVTALDTLEFMNIALLLEGAHQAMTRAKAAAGEYKFAESWSIQDEGDGARGLRQVDRGSKP